MRKGYVFFLVLGLSGLLLASLLVFVRAGTVHAASYPTATSVGLGASVLPASALGFSVEIPLTTPLLYEGFEGAFELRRSGDVSVTDTSHWVYKVMPPGDEHDATWVQFNTVSHSGSSSVYHQDVNAQSNSWLVTPQVTPTIDSELVFWQRTRYLEEYLRHSVWVSAGRQDPKYYEFTLLSEVTPTLEEEWEEVSLPLGAFAGQPVFVAFRYEGDHSTRWYVDDVKVTTGVYAINDGPTALGDVTAFTASVAPGRVASFTWDFGDSTIGSGAAVTHTYLGTGVYTAVVTASNSVSAITTTTTVGVWNYVHLPLVLRN
jgi:hypothetical protein